MSLRDALGPEGALLHGYPPTYTLSGHYNKRSRLLSVARRLSWSVYTRASERAQEVFLRQEVKRLKPSIVLAQFGPTGVKFMPVCNRLEIPLVTFFHGYDATRRTVLRKRKDDYRDLFDNSAGLIAVSRSIRNRLIALGAPEDKVFVSPCGADCTLFYVSSPVTEPFTFLSVGRLVEKKAPHLTILAFSKLVRRFPRCKLKLVGEGKLLGACKSLVKALDVQDNVIFLGSIPHEEVQAQMASAFAYVQHSITAAHGEEEGTPVSIMEAGASGLPVVSTKHAGIPDVVVEGKTGLLVDEAEVEAMADAMCYLVENPSVAREMGEQASDRVRKHFDAQKLAKRVQKIADWIIDPSTSKPELVPLWLQHAQVSKSTSDLEGDAVSK